MAPPHPEQGKSRHKLSAGERSERQNGKDNEMITKGYKRSWKTRRRLSFSISLSLSTFCLSPFLIHTPEGSPRDYPVPRLNLFASYPVGLRSLDRSSPFTRTNCIITNYPPPLPKRVLSKLVPAVQMGVIGIIMAAEQIFPMLGFMVPPPWYYSLRANRFGSIATTWLLGNVLQNFLQSTGAFEVYLNDEPVFSKLKKVRFPGEIEWKDLINKKLANPQVLHNYQVMWS